MPGLDPKVVVHCLSIRKGVSLKKQSQQRFPLELISEIGKEVNKLIEAGFIREVKYPTLIADIVPIRKKNGQLCVYVVLPWLVDEVHRRRGRATSSGGSSLKCLWCTPVLA